MVTDSQRQICTMHVVQLGHISVIVRVQFKMSNIALYNPTQDYGDTNCALFSFALYRLQLYASFL